MPSFSSYTTATIAGSGTLTLTAPTSPAPSVGDLIYAFILGQHTGGPPSYLGSGWTNAYSIFHGTSTNALSGAIFFHSWTGTEGSDANFWKFTVAGASTGNVIVYSDVDSTIPIANFNAIPAFSGALPASPGARSITFPTLVNPIVQPGYALAVAAAYISSPTDTVTLGTGGSAGAGYVSRFATTDASGGGCSMFWWDAPTIVAGPSYFTGPNNSASDAWTGTAAEQSGAYQAILIPSGVWTAQQAPSAASEVSSGSDISGWDLLRMYSSKNDSASSQTITITVPPAANNFLLCIVTANATATLTTPSGWSLLTTITTAENKFRLYSKVAAGTETSVSLNFSGPTASAAAYMEFPSGMGVSWTEASDATSGTSITGPSQTGMTSGHHLYSFSTQRVASGSSGFTSTTSGTGWTEILDLATTNAGINRNLTIAENTTSTGTVAGATTTWSATGSEHAAISLAIYTASRVNTYADDNSRAIFGMDSTVAKSSKWLLATNFGLGIADNASILGVAFDVYQRTYVYGSAIAANAGTVNLSYQLVIGGALSATTEKADVYAVTPDVNNSPTSSSPADNNYYAPAQNQSSLYYKTDTWNLPTTLTPAVLNATDFGLGFQARGIGNGSAIKPQTTQVDYIVLNVWWWEPPEGGNIPLQFCEA